MIPPRFPDRQVGDTAHAFVFRFAQSIAGGAATFRMTRVDVTPPLRKVNDAAAQLVSSTEAQYQPIPADVDTVGQYECQMFVTLADGRVLKSRVIEHRIVRDAV